MMIQIRFQCFRRRREPQSSRLMQMKGMAEETSSLPCKESSERFQKLLYPNC